jgi:hypothetical protein
MTGHARALKLEHGERLVRLDLKKLTVVTDTPQWTLSPIFPGS